MLEARFWHRSLHRKTGANDVIPNIQSLAGNVALVTGKTGA
jgi:hypothetical protein